MKRRWCFLPLLALGFAWWGILSIPGPVQLKLYDVDADELVYAAPSSFPSVDISLATRPEPYYPPRLTGNELAERIEWLLPESRDKNSHEVIVFLDGYIAVRATPTKQAAVRAILGLHKLRNRVLVAVHAHDVEIKEACSRLVGKVLLRK